MSIKETNSKYAPKITPEIETKIIKMVGQLKTPFEISKEVGLSSTGVKAFLKRKKLPIYRPTPVDISRPCQICGTIFSPKYSDGVKKDKYVTCSKPCGKESIRRAKQKYSAETVQQVIELKKLGTPHIKITELTGVKVSKIKQITKKHGLFLDPVLAQKNAYAAALAVNPDKMRDVRKHLTQEARDKTSESLKKTYAAPEWKEFFSNKSNKYWADFKQLPKEEQEAKLKIKGKALSEFKLGMSEEAYLEILNKVKAMVEKDGISPTAAARMMGLSPVTVVRKFRKLGWEDLISKSKCSQGQKEMYDFVLSLCPDTVLNDRTALENGAELDIYVPSKKLGIEYNGLYWHSEAADGWKTRKHLYKKKKCENAGINLLAIYEDEWEDPVKKELIKSMIKNRIGLNDQVSIGARKLHLTYFDKNLQFEEFFDKNHLDGHKRSSYAWALVDDNKEIIMCASFGNNRQGDLEINRMATKQGFQVPGGASRLLSKIDRDLYSFSNNRLSDGNVYKQLGFKPEKMSDQPSYWYTDGAVRIWRFKCKRNNSPEILAEYPTEKTQAAAGVFSEVFFGDDRPLFRIEDYGHKKWVLKGGSKSQSL